MIIGIPKEIKKEEYRVALTPSGAEELKKDRHTILVETGAGEGSGFSDAEYINADADIVAKETLFKKSDLLIKVKEPLPPEYNLIKQGQAIFTYLHLAPNRELTELLLKKQAAGFAYETLQKNGTLPLLAPMSEIAGRMAPIMGAYYLQKIHNGEGVLVTGATGVKPAKALILGAGVVGANAAHVCIGIGMETVVISKGFERLQKLNQMFIGKVKALPLTEPVVRAEIKDADIIIGAVLVTGGKTPVLITRDMLKTMRKGAVIIDVSVDQGGCIETSMPTTHDNPVYAVEGIIHYCVANMPGAYPRTSTLALTNATLPYIKTLASKGIERSVREDSALRSSLNTYKGSIVHKTLADSIGIAYKNIDDILK